MKVIKVYFDGACANVKDDVAPMGIGVCVYDGTEWLTEYEFALNAGMGTSNRAEYTALNFALRVVENMKKSGKFEKCAINIYSDSQLVVNQFNGSWSINSKELKQLCLMSKQYAEKIGFKQQLIWIRRDGNTKADELSKFGLKYGVKLH